MELKSGGDGPKSAKKQKQVERRGRLVIPELRIRLSEVSATLDRLRMEIKLKQKQTRARAIPNLRDLSDGVDVQTARQDEAKAAIEDLSTLLSLRQEIDEETVLLQEKRRTTQVLDQLAELQRQVSESTKLVQRNHQIAAEKLAASNAVLKQNEKTIAEQRELLKELGNLRDIRASAAAADAKMAPLSDLLKELGNLQNIRAAVAAAEAQMAPLRELLKELGNLRDIRAAVADTEARMVTLGDLPTQADRLKSHIAALQAELALKQHEVFTVDATLLTAQWSIASDEWGLAENRGESKDAPKPQCAETHLIKKWKVHQCSTLECKDERCPIDCDAFSSKTLDEALKNDKKSVANVYNPVLKFSYTYDLVAMTQVNNDSKRIRKLVYGQEKACEVQYKGRCTDKALLDRFVDPRIHSFYSVKDNVFWESISQYSAEYRDVSKWFLDSPMTSGRSLDQSFDVDIQNIERVINVPLARLFAMHRISSMSQPPADRVETLGFHGTKGNDPYQVTARGLNPLVGDKACYLEQGVYGAASSLYSHNGYRHQKLDGTFVLLVARFLMGKCYNTTRRTVGEIRVKTYDSVIGSFDDCDIWAVYERSRCYITHIVTYSAVAKKAR